MVSPLKVLIHTKLLTKAAKSKEEPSKFLNTLMFPQETAKLYKPLLLNNPLPSELMLNLGNSTLEVSYLLQDVELN